MLSKELKKEFWKEVKRVLVEEYKRTTEKAEDLIKTLRKDYKRYKVGDGQYHEHPKNIAEDLSKWD